MRSGRPPEGAGALLRWTVSHRATSIRAVALGLGVAWLPEDNIAAELAAGTLKVLPMDGGVGRSAILHLMHADPDYPGRHAARLGAIIAARVAERCAQDRRKRASR